MLIRRAEERDTSDLGDVYVGALAVMEGLPDRWTDAENRAFVRDVLVVSNNVWVAQDGHRSLGFVGLSDGTVRHLYVRPAAQNRGVGTALLAHAKALRPDGLRLSVVQANAGARRFYERHGFRLTGIGDGSDTPEGVPEAFYAWRPGTVDEPPPP